MGQMLRHNAGATKKSSGTMGIMTRQKKKSPTSGRTKSTTASPSAVPMLMMRMAFQNHAGRAIGLMRGHDQAGRRISAGAMAMPTTRIDASKASQGAPGIDAAAVPSCSASTGACVSAAGTSVAAGRRRSATCIVSGIGWLRPGCLAMA